MSDKELIKHCKKENSLSYNQLKEMNQKELDQLLSVCWKEAQYKGGYNENSLRCYASGVRFLTYHQEHNILGWSDDEGDPNVEYKSPDEKVHHIDDGTWGYGIYKSVQQVKADNRDKKIKQILK